MTLCTVYVWRTGKSIVVGKLAYFGSQSYPGFGGLSNHTHHAFIIEKLIPVTIDYRPFQYLLEGRQNRGPDAMVALCYGRVFGLIHDLDSPIISKALLGNEEDLLVPLFVLTGVEGTDTGGGCCHVAQSCMDDCVETSQLFWIRWFQLFRFWVAFIYFLKQFRPACLYAHGDVELLGSDAGARHPRIQYQDKGMVQWEK